MNLNENHKLVGSFYLKKIDENGEVFFNGKIGENLMLNEGINEMWKLVAGGTATAFNNSNSYLGVGDDSTPAAATQTGLLASSNKYYQAMDGSFPTYGTLQKITFQSTFGASVANFSWQEFTVANGNSDSAINLDRLVLDQGIKILNQVWVLSLVITLS
jgi:hypothetical protein